MALKPKLKAKVDELFLCWISDPIIQQSLEENLRQIVASEVITQPLQSPRLRPESPPHIPSSHKLASPRNNRQIIVTNSLNGKENKQTVRELPVPRTPSSVNIPRFYFPTGQPAARTETDTILKRVQQEFSKVEGGKAYKHHMAMISKACGLPVYWKMLLFRAAGGEETKFITFQQFSTMWKGVVKENHDTASRFVYLSQCPTGGLKQMTSTRHYLMYDDFKPLIQDIIETHPGLTFLLDAPEFHSRYVTTVISRIFFCANRSWTGKLTVQEIRRSNFLQIVDMLEREEDINEVTDFFSYQHFYVIYCKFWELDRDHDLFIDKRDLFRHNDHALSMRVIDRIFSGAVTRGSTFEQGKMSYTEFVWFLIAEEDKKHPTSIEYWFRCMDLDGDGIISMYEMEFFYEEQVQKMEALGIEKLPFEDCLCQMLDLVSPKVKDTITLQDLKNCKMTDIFFDTFFNLDKFLDHEQRDAFANLRDPEMDGPEPTDWERYAADEYELLVAEEGANDHELEEM
ncbi:hypothetical protein LOTGIDRAFT_125808 [Lottia gigantea]|uniref:EF-hand domain-containing protein n=1 Tax=Lottia gigantea TaxID=225164 RepID=V4BIZ2_LOTGI|nr:hypothetical protein LOTGIDRAFT_125808 [Lottia gigantea]ESO88694.1 hypothetical protein LOTGIDRAFT_125808 [Lottia gigantea]